MRVLVVFPDVPRAVFTTALGWYRAISRDPSVNEVLCANTRGYYHLPDRIALPMVPTLTGVDVVVVVSGRQAFDQLQPGELPAAKRALILTDEPYETELTEQFNSGKWSGTYHAVASNDSVSAHRHESGFFLPCAFDDTIDIRAQLGPKWDIGFIGTVDDRRVQWLSVVDDACRGASWCLLGPKWKPRHWSRWRSRRKRVRMNTSPASGYLGPDEVVRNYAKCRVVLNIHREGGGARSPNPRTYDLLGHGIPAVQDLRADTPESVVQVATAQEMGEFVRGFIAGHEREVARMQDSVATGLSLADKHSYSARWRELKARLSV